MLAADIDDRADPDRVIARALSWIRDFVAHPNPDVGRKGPVCPFVPTSLTRNLMSFVELAGPVDRTRIVECLKELRGQFLEQFPTEDEGRAALFKTFVIVFPEMRDEDAQELIDQVQSDLKPTFVRDVLMLGQFHPNNETEGIRNTAFRPLKSPVPMLVIRYMLQSDIVFLKDEAYSPMDRMQFAVSYLRMCQRLDVGPKRFRDHAGEVKIIIEELFKEILRDIREDAAVD
jgi:hypothetical protein